MVQQMVTISYSGTLKVLKSYRNTGVSTVMICWRYCRFSLALSKTALLVKLMVALAMSAEKLCRG